LLLFCIKRQRRSDSINEKIKLDTSTTLPLPSLAPKIKKYYANILNLVLSSPTTKDSLSRRVASSQPLAMSSRWISQSTVFIMFKCQLCIIVFAALFCAKYIFKVLHHYPSHCLLDFFQFIFSCRLMNSHLRRQIHYFR
jgi:hypothetical protein